MTFNVSTAPGATTQTLIVMIIHAEHEFHVLPVLLIQISGYSKPTLYQR